MQVLLLLSSFSHIRLCATPWTAAYIQDSSIHGIFQARVLEWVAIAFSRYADNTTLTAESKELKCLLMKVERGK